MKHKITFLAIGLLLTLSSYAQPSLDYTFVSELQGVYSPLSGDADIFTGNFDDDVSMGIDITPVSIGGAVYSVMFVSTNGYLTLGQGSNANNYAPLANTQVAMAPPTISPLGRDLAGVDATSRISYVVDETGTHVQWHNVRRYGVSMGESLSFQAHILPSDSAITFVYGSFNMGAGSGGFAQVGIRVGAGDFPDFYSNRMVAQGGSWFPSQQGTSFTSSCFFGAGSLPFSGLTYNWGAISGVVFGCADENACNYDPAAQLNDGSCEYCSCQACGCMDSIACNYDPQAFVSINCEYGCYGCTDNTALNYDNTASIDDGSCSYFSDGMSCVGPIAIACGEGWYTGQTMDIPNDNTTSGATACGGPSMGGQLWYAYNAPFASSITISTINDITDFDTFLKVYTGTCGDLTCVVENDDIPNTNFQSEVTFQADADVTYLIRVGGFSTSSGTYALSIDCGGGCLDSLACNYQAAAPFDDGSCTYGDACYGCTDMNAVNYAPQAVYDEGCEYHTTIVVYHDTNGDGERQNNEPGMSNWSVYIPELEATIFTDNHGTATLSAAANTYTIELNNSSDLWINSSPSSLVVEVPLTMTASFGLLPATGEAFFATGPYNGFWDIIHCDDGYEAGVFLNNLGTVDLSGTLTLTCDELFTPGADTDNTIAPDSTAAGFAQWNIASFAAGTNGIFSFHIAGPGPINIGTTYNFNLHLELVDVQGNVIYDDSWTTSPFIACAYDPNDLTATPEGYEAPNFVLAGDRLQYRVRFQNTGNLPAEDVRIAGYLDPSKFDLNTFSPLYGSASFVTGLLSDGSLEFTFDDIYLPDATNNEPESHGYVVYEVELLPGIIPNEVVLNQASIYFDNNPAIITNETFHTIFDCSSFESMTGATSVCVGSALILDATQPYVENYEWTINGQTVIDNGASLETELPIGTHWISLTTSNPLCGASHDAVIEVHALPEVTVPAAAAVCAGESVELLAEANGTIIWGNSMNNGTNYLPTKDIVLTATVTDFYGCVNSADWELTVLPLPSADYTTEGITLTAIDGVAWQWYLNNMAIEGATSNSYTMTEPGAYSVLVTGSNDCSAMSSITNLTVDIIEASDAGIIIFPNPMDQLAQIRFPSGTYDVILSDMTGREVAGYRSCAQQLTLNREGWASGTYVLVISGEGFVAHQRLIIK